MTSFTNLGLVAPLLKALTAEGYETPTPIQIQAIPHILSGRDLCGIAQTGTGKTAAFGLPILQKLSADPRPVKPRHCRALIFSPTRELASQIADSIRIYGKFLRLSVAVIFGGVPVPRHERQMARGVDILVATPGRLLDLIDRRALALSEVELLVLDEADQMLDLGFIHALKRVVTLLPKKRQSLFFSATMPKTIASLAAQFLTDPVQVSVTPVATTAERVEQQVIFVATPQKQALLEIVLKDKAIDRALVFTRTKHGADRVVKHLTMAGIEAAAIHGNKSQNQRERALAAFRTGDSRILVATDIAARGIDVEGVSHVVNFDLPNVPESYVHRIGRTARAGADGLAVSFCNGEERAYLRDIERLIRQKIWVAPTPAHLPQTVFEPDLDEASRQRRPGRAGKPAHGRAAQGKPAAHGKHGHGKPAGKAGGGKPLAGESADKNRGRGRPGAGSGATHNSGRRLERTAHVRRSGA